MEITILGKAKDFRTNSNVIYAQMNIKDYLTLIGDDFDDFRFQRKRVNYKPYQRMKQDIIEGALLPNITLGIKKQYVDKIAYKLNENLNLNEDLLELQGKLLILDGLQRTYILKDIFNSGHQFNPQQKVMLEFWVEKDIKHLIYRLIILNAGQKKMSMRHQMELLFLNVKESIEEEIPYIEIHTQRESTRRNKPGKFALDKIVMGYQSFLLANPEVKRSNIVAQEMLENSILDSSAEKLGYEFELYKRFLSKYVGIDCATYRHYERYNSISNKQQSWFFDEDESVMENNLSNYKNLFSNENVITSFFAAIYKYLQKQGDEDNLMKILDEMENYIYEAKDNSDPLDIETLKRLQEGMNPRLSSLDFQTRALLFEGFLEYFRNNGEISFAECWAKGAY